MSSETLHEDPATLGPEVTDQHRAIGKIAVRDSVPQVGLVGLARLCHVTLRATADAATSNRRRLACQQFSQDHGVVVRLVAPSW